MAFRPGAAGAGADRTGGRSPVNTRHGWNVPANLFRPQSKVCSAVESRHVTSCHRSILLPNHTVLLSQQPPRPITTLRRYLKDGTDEVVCRVKEVRTILISFQLRVQYIFLLIPVVDHSQLLFK